MKEKPNNVGHSEYQYIMNWLEIDENQSRELSERKHSALLLPSPGIQFWCMEAKVDLLLRLCLSLWIRGKPATGNKGYTDM